jgi:hypothetical protein
VVLLWRCGTALGPSQPRTRLRACETVLQCERTLQCSCAARRHSGTESHHVAASHCAVHDIVLACGFDRSQLHRDEGPIGEVATEPWAETGFAFEGYGVLRWG